ncbi:hypothetical protein FACS189420_0580 [Bacteroidia bacterium]|nr:hypothetical protein FACS189420_0580 [Bacteroidia bacterium]
MAQEPLPISKSVIEALRNIDESATDSISVKNDSISTQKNDSIKSNAIDAPINTTSRDSMVMTMDGKNMLYLFGEASIKYREMDLTGEYIEINADSSLVYSSFALDSVGERMGYPIFKEGEKQYDMEQVWYNFKTKKMLVYGIITQEGEGYLTAEKTKKMPDDDLFMNDGKYSTCDEHEHPHFYIKLTKARIRPKKNVVSGPAYLVIEDVPMPIGIPFGFFPFSSDYSSGVLMPTYGDEMTRGFSLRDGGYYFAINNHVDLALQGEIYTKGSWGLNAKSNYRKMYKYSGNLNASYLVTVMGDKDTKGLEKSDYSKTKDIKLTWSHSQDSKANPFSTMSASVNFSTSSFDRNSLNSIYDPDVYSQNTKSSNITYSYRHPTLPVSISANTSVNQSSRDTTLSFTLPNLNISMSQIYPFKRKEQVGDQRWYEKIYMSYTGSVMNSINNVKEYDFLKKNVIKDWKNGMRHQIPIATSLNLFKYINISPSFNYTERWYTSQVTQRYDDQLKRLVPVDTLYGFNRVYDFSGSVSANAKLYGLFKPWRLFGKWTEGVQIRHVMTPSVSFSGSPDFGDPRYGYYREYEYVDANGNKVPGAYSLYDHTLWRAPSPGKTGALNFSLENNLEAKAPVAGSDSISDRKISLIDNLGLSMSYNFLADSMKWSNLRASIRIKLFGHPLSLQGEFDTYLYDEQGRPINQTRLNAGKGIGRFRGTSTGYSYSLNNDVIKKWFKKGDNKTAGSNTNGSDPLDSDPSNTLNSGDESNPQRTSLRQAKKNSENYDDDGYQLLNIPWNLSFNYSINLGYDMQRFDKIKREYPYKITQTVGINGNISPTKAWNLTFNTSYDFDYKKFATMQCSISRQMHCWTMSASVIPIGPYQSYSFTIAVKSNLLQDLKYTQSSNSRDAVNWGY